MFVEKAMTFDFYEVSNVCREGDGAAHLIPTTVAAAPHLFLSTYGSKDRCKLLQLQSAI
ncbi:hypothetical protein I3842_16G088600 [Carya illinoinensis]|uniref:Uncharacterized protein n=1 Tax=Carya illinoinensis TaxID=32201 RepID=A0A922A7R7_CARIL|nr:hypothetical protein I3842_16G088600 [Carya illinoinensis]